MAQIRKCDAEDKKKPEITAPSKLDSDFWKDVPTGVPMEDE